MTTDWTIGYVIGGVVVLAVVALVTPILILAKQIGDVHRREEPVIGDLHDDDQDRQHTKRLDEAVGAFQAYENA